MTEAQEEAAYAAQDDWIRHNYGKVGINPLTNPGWFVDEVEETIATKIYGHVVLVTHVPTLTHRFEAFS